jgi:hypothetical protein
MSKPEDVERILEAFGPPDEVSTTPILTVPDGVRIFVLKECTFDWLGVAGHSPELFCVRYSPEPGVSREQAVLNLTREAAVALIGKLQESL